VDHIFPPLNFPASHFKPDTDQLEYSHFSFWREPLSQLDDDSVKNPVKIRSQSYVY
jgi:hypothetical protein